MINISGDKPWITVFACFPGCLAVNSKDGDEKEASAFTFKKFKKEFNLLKCNTLNSQQSKSFLMYSPEKCPVLGISQGILGFESQAIILPREN